MDNESAETRRLDLRLNKHLHDGLTAFMEKESPGSKTTALRMLLADGLNALESLLRGDGRLPPPPAGPFGDEYKVSAFVDLVSCRRLDQLANTLGDDRYSKRPDIARLVIGLSLPLTQLPRVPRERNVIDLIKGAPRDTPNPAKPLGGTVSIAAWSLHAKKDTLAGRLQDASTQIARRSGRCQRVEAGCVNAPGKFAFIDVLVDGESILPKPVSIGGEDTGFLQIVYPRADRSTIRKGQTITLRVGSGSGGDVSGAQAHLEMVRLR